MKIYKICGFIPYVDKESRDLYKDRLKHVVLIHSNSRKTDVKYFNEEEGDWKYDFEKRPVLIKAIGYCLEKEATFTVASVKGLRRRKWEGLKLLDEIVEQGIDIEVVDDCTINKHSITVLAASSVVSREKMLTRSTEALQRIKSKLARNEVHISASGRKIAKLGAHSDGASTARSLAADKFAAKIFPIIEPYLKTGESYNSIATRLNRLKIKTSRGGKFYHSTVRAIIRRHKQKSAKTGGKNDK